MGWDVRQWSGVDWMWMTIAFALVGFCVYVTAKDQREKFVAHVLPHWKRWRIERPPARFFAKKAGWLILGLAVSAGVVALFPLTWWLLSLVFGPTSPRRP